ncbi:hypothetical protein EGM51_03725 [Verrucomicrobia bacterium S94]|nr:hypothetical protein EGM51_03725 [Verrucomicrobia bacterium S94]
MPKELIEARKRFFDSLAHAEYLDEKGHHEGAACMRKCADISLDIDIRLFELSHFKHIAA